MRDIGSVRQSQALLTFGIGAIVDMRDTSVMPLGLEHWPAVSDCPRVYERDLERMLGVDRLVAPPIEQPGRHESAKLNVVRFPRWLFCPECKALGMTREVADGRPGPQLDSPWLYPFESSGGQPAICLGNSGGDRCGTKVVPTRLVVACYHAKRDLEVDHPGHIDDFPWMRWAHCGTPSAGKHYLELSTARDTLWLGDLHVQCSCGAKRSLGDALQPGALSDIGARCSGWSPWLESRRDAGGCYRPIRGFLRGATNLHLTVPRVVISIPPSSGSASMFVDARIENLEEAWWGAGLRASAEGSSVEDFARQWLERVRGRGEEPPRTATEADLIAAVVDRLSDSGRDHDPRRTDHSARRLAEYDALWHGTDGPEGTFHAEPVDVPSSWGDYIARVVKVHRLREVKALLGFRRITKGGAGLDQDDDETPYASLSREPKDWLPAVELRGEGVFLALDPDRVTEWSERRDVQDRLRALRAHAEAFACEGRRRPPRTDARFVLTHTFAHLVMRQLSLECGYSAAALAERLYVGSAEEPVAGVLIYTSTTDSDGGLGGLVRMGDPGRLDPVLRQALVGAEWCSSDPVCRDSGGQGYGALNRAACHACALVSETSCECGNGLLDRALVTPLRGYHGSKAYFNRPAPESWT